MKRIILIFAVFFYVAAIHAQSSARLVVWQKSGEKVYFNLTEEPKTTFENGLLVITTNTMQTSYQLSNILRYTYEGVITGISKVSNDLTVSQSNDGITLNNVPAGTALRLYDTAGRLLDTKTSNGESSVHFSLTERPAGVYLVNMNDHTFKITKR